MSDYLLVATIDHDSGLAEDRVSNSFAVTSTGSASSAQLDAMFDAVAAFYNILGTSQTNTMADYLSPELSLASGGLVVDGYLLDGHLDGSPHGSPIRSKAYTLDGPDVTTPLPSECALAITLEGIGRAAAAVEAVDGADPGSAPDRPKQRRTGRIFLGPLNTQTLSTGTANEARPSGTFRLDALNAVKNLSANITAAGPTSTRLAVWSRANAFLYSLEAVSCDDAFDTQRRRGVAPTARGRFTLP